MSFFWDLIADAKHALRVYWRTPGSTLIAVVGLGVAIASVTAFLSLYVDLILRPHAGFERGGGLVTYGWSDGGNAGGLPYELITRIEQEATTLLGAGIGVHQFTVGSERETYIIESVTPTFFSNVRPRLALGRGFEHHEHAADAEPVAVVSYRYWQQYFGGGPDVLGGTVDVYIPPVSQGPGGAVPVAEVPATRFRIVGVMGREFTGTLPPQQNLEAHVWIPIEQLLAAQGQPNASPGPTLRGIGRRAPGATSRTITTELRSRYGDILPDYLPRDNAQFDTIDNLVFSLPIQRSTERQLLLLLGGSVLLTIVAAANIGLFLLARAPGRRREIAIRMAVGATFRRLARQLASEAAVLVATGAALGIAGSVWLAGYLRDLTFLRNAQWRDVTLLDWRVLLILGAALLVLTALVSLAPLPGLKKAGIAASSRQVAATASAAQRVAGSVQIAVAGALGGAAVAFTWYLASLMLADPGYLTRDLHAVTFSVQQTGPIAIDGAVLSQTRYREALATLPGVRSVSVASMVPGASFPINAMLVHPDNPTDQISIMGSAIDHNYMDLLGLNLLYGRTPTASDTSVILVNQALARRMWGRDNVVGEQIPISVDGSAGSEVIGVTRDLSFQHPLDDVPPMAFIAPGPVFNSGVALVDSSLTAAQLRQSVQALVDSGALEVTITDVASLQTLRHNAIAADRARSFLTITAATLVVILAALGFYGTQRYVVTAGRREYAIRASLGAGPRVLGRLVLWRGLALGLPGLAFGLPLAFILVAWLRDDFITNAISPLAVTLAVAIVMAGLLLGASLGPARQARRTQPAPLLREE